jgi:hypothetical protein
MKVGDRVVISTAFPYQVPAQGKAGEVVEAPIFVKAPSGNVIECVAVRLFDKIDDRKVIIVTEPKWVVPAEQLS